MKKENEINGFLYLPAIGLLLSCIVGTFNLYKITKMLYMQIIEDKPVVLWFSIYMVIIGIIFQLWTYYATILFYSQKKKAIKAMIILYILNFISYTPVFLYLHFFKNIPMSLRMQSVVIAGVVGVVIWIPYFMRSRKVKAVFYK